MTPPRRKPISLEAAREIVRARASPGPAEVCALMDALGRVLAETVHAARDSPSFASSAMDGYALRAGPAGRVLRLVDESRAGRPAERALADAEAIRISTGAAVPAGADAVIRQEDTRPADGAVETLTASAPGENIRRPGEDLRAGAPVLDAGVRIGAAELAVAVAAGRAELSVHRRPRVSVLTSGDELRGPGEPLTAGAIHDSNGPMLTALAQRSGGRVTLGRRLPDDPAGTRDGLARALEEADVLLVAGGVSVGPHDHVKGALGDLGVAEHFWGIAIRPGAPLWFGTRGHVLVFGLPGNPVSAAVTFALLVGPALERLQGATAPRLLVGSARLAEPVTRHPTRVQAIRVRLEERDGRLLARPSGPQGSHVTLSLLTADALALVPPGEGSLAAGAEVRLEPAPR